MSDEGEFMHHEAKHRRDDVPVDAEPDSAASDFGGLGAGEPDLSEFGENPDTELAG